MESHPCDTDRKNTIFCPVYQSEGRCYADTHHTEYPSGLFRTTLEKNHRNLEGNKVFVCRALHNAIHASGYRPDPPSRATMAEEIWQGPTERQAEELEKQIKIGSIVLDGLPEDAA